MRSRVSKTAVAVALVVLGGVLLTAAASGAPPDTPPVGATQPVREQNLDAAGRINVHEQGTADVHITNPSLDVSVGNFPSSVEVSNFPATQNVNVVGGAPPAPVEQRVQVNFETAAGGFETTTFAQVDATLITITGFNDEEKSVRLQTPLGGTFFALYDPDGAQAVSTIQLHSPLPVTGVELVCLNESDDCLVWVTIIGF